MGRISDLQPTAPSEGGVTDGYVKVEIPMADGWFGYGLFLWLEGELRLVEVRIFPGEGRPYRVSFPDDHGRADQDPALSERLTTEGSPIPEVGEWSQTADGVYSKIPANGQITARLIKALPLHDLRDQAERLAHVYRGVERKILSLKPSSPEWESLKEDMKVWDTTRSAPSDLRLAQIAARYVELSEQEATRSRPRAALAAEIDRDSTYVRNLLASARRAQLLRSNGQGTSGGRLTARALTILTRNDETKGSTS